MITFLCDLCKQPAIPRTNRDHRAFCAEDSPTLPELVYEGLHIVFFAHKYEEGNDKLTPFMKRDLRIADLCQECLRQALERGREVTKEEIEQFAAQGNRP
jgi:hypothetical protein